MAKTDIKTVKSVVPMIYCYTTPEIKRHDGWSKIGYTENDVDKRLKQQTHTADIRYEEEWRMTATYDDGSGESFTDHDFHRYLVEENIRRQPKTEWFEIIPRNARNMLYTFKARKTELDDTRCTEEYELRNEQKLAVSKTIDYMRLHEGGAFLWNAKPRFGKTLAVYDFARKIQAKKVLVVTNRPAIANSWYSDFMQFVPEKEFTYFVSNTPALRGKNCVVDSDSDLILHGAPYIEFESLQDLKGSVYFGGQYQKYRKISNTEWDLLVIDEAHEGVDTYKTDVLFDHIQYKFALHLSGTPFKALANDKFDEDAIFNWTYVDEQQAKENWPKNHMDPTEPDPYKNLPQLSMFTYKMSEMIENVIREGTKIGDEREDYAFDLNEFFSTNDSKTDKGIRFKHEAAVNNFLDALTRNEKYPFSTPELRDELKHTVWMLDRVDSCKALARKLEDHPVFKDYKIVLAAGDGSVDDVKETESAYTRVKDAIANYKYTITLTVGQLMTGITVKEWTAVLMLSNISSPSLYMQAAFRAQNPCLFQDGTKCYRKERAYVFDFDPARNLVVYEKFANDLSSETSDGRGSTSAREDNIKRLLNFFPVIGEDDEGKMVELDAAEVLSVPRKIKSTEVVKRGFVSNFLFQNISNIFGAPSEVVKILEKFTPVEEPNKKDIPISAETAEELYLDENSVVSLDESVVEKHVEDFFGAKLFEDMGSELKKAVDDIQFSKEDKPKKNNSKEELTKVLTKKITEPLIEQAKLNYGKGLSTGEQNRITRTIKTDVKIKVEKAYGDFDIQRNINETEKNEKLNLAKTDEEVAAIYAEAAKKDIEAQEAFKQAVNQIAVNAPKEQAVNIVKTVETHQKNVEKQSIEEGVRDHLRGFTRTIPSFLMAYGNKDTKLSSFDMIIPGPVFFEVTSITLDEFRFLRDGGEYVDEETGQKKWYEGHLFDEDVFDESVQRFLELKTRLANYFDAGTKEDIFDFIPPQKTNQIFTPKKVVAEMVDYLEQENPGCFDDPDNTFIDPYMKSGLYIAEIVKRLYRSEKMKDLFPDKQERLNHIFAKQVYGLAPTEIIYRIAKSFLLDFTDEFSIEKDNLRLLDSLPLAQEGKLEEALAKEFPERCR